MFYLPFKNDTNPVKVNGETTDISYFGYGFIPKYSLVFQNYYERSVSRTTELNWQLAQKLWLGTSEEVKSSRFVFHTDMQ